MNERIVWKERQWPCQWVGMCPHHSGGIRCNDRKSAEDFMADLCASCDCPRLAGGVSS